MLCLTSHMSNEASNATVHYSYGGNAYWNIPATGFCGAKAGSFTNARAEITCAACEDSIA